MPHTLAAQLGQSIFLIVIALSAWKGGRTERVAAAALLVQLIFSSLVNHTDGFSLEGGVLLADVAALIIFVWLAFGSNRRWTLWATAFQALAVLTHFARMLDPSLHQWAYMSTAIFWGYAVLCALGVGTAQAALERRREAAARSEAV